MKRMMTTHLIKIANLPLVIRRYTYLLQFHNQEYKHMPRSNFRLIAIFIISVLLSSTIAAADLSRSRPEELGISSERLGRLDTVLNSYVEENLIAGQVLLVLRKGRIAHSLANGMRDIEATDPMKEDTIFRIASQTKALVSTGIMILHERGQLDISHPLSRYIPEWENVQVAVPNENGSYNLEPVERPITLRHLLTHTAGMSYGTGPASREWEEADFQGWYFANKTETIGESIARMASLPLDAHPGTAWIYGYNTDILGAVIEKASGMDLNNFLQQEIFEPLEMSDSHFYLPENKRDRLAVVYQPKPGGGIQAIPATDGMRSQGLYIDGPRISYSGGAGLLSTANDYARFLQMTLNGGELDGKRILSRKTIELMTTNHLGDLPFRSGQGFGLGFSIVTDLGERGTLGSVGEYGWGGAYHSTYWVDPLEELVVVYLTQIIPATGLDDYSKLRSGVYQAIID
ncbi:MAG: beta-lactamase family protein [Pseudomonadales bacterium]|jgi:CubicO group peptidase (beta-lactamase class C family)|nr:beta-lactamase family protein [Pseudomonadales bacterium]MEC7765588.1 serine hydrolase domain-containing protein [Pseudomonadota bacterium]MED5530059.1 serine hydrolase domain-containing protein [Pseudomonadota bacterium]|tara:strand:- start:6178 stop:7557 length:1380 start_codon:yes stop_codon:yes gene_type:complete